MKVGTRLVSQIDDRRFFFGRLLHDRKVKSGRVESGIRRAPPFETARAVIGPKDGIQSFPIVRLPFSETTPCSQFSENRFLGLKENPHPSGVNELESFKSEGTHRLDKPKDGEVSHVNIVVEERSSRSLRVGIVE